jgi:hypothetical protein
MQLSKENGKRKRKRKRKLKKRKLYKQYKK